MSSECNDRIDGKPCKSSTITKTKTEVFTPIKVTLIFSKSFLNVHPFFLRICEFLIILKSEFGLNRNQYVLKRPKLKLKKNTKCISKKSNTFFSFQG